MARRKKPKAQPTVVEEGAIAPALPTVEQIYVLPDEETGTLESYFFKDKQFFHIRLDKQNEADDKLRESKFHPTFTFTAKNKDESIDSDAVVYTDEVTINEDNDIMISGHPYSENEHYFLTISLKDEQQEVQDTTVIELQVNVEEKMSGPGIDEEEDVDQPAHSDDQPAEQPANTTDAQPASATPADNQPASPDPEDEDIGGSYATSDDSVQPASTANSAPSENDDGATHADEVDNSTHADAQPAGDATVSQPTSDADATTQPPAEDAPASSTDQPAAEDQGGNQPTETTEDTPMNKPTETTDESPAGQPVDTAEQPAGTTDDDPATTTEETHADQPAGTTEEVPAEQPAGTTEETPAETSTPSTSTGTVDNSATEQPATAEGSNTTAQPADTSAENKELNDAIAKALMESNLKENRLCTVVEGTEISLGRVILAPAGTKKEITWTKNDAPLSGVTTQDHYTLTPSVSDSGEYVKTIKFLKDGVVHSSHSIAYTLVVSAKPDPYAPTNAPDGNTTQPTDTPEEEVANPADVGLDGHGTTDVEVNPIKVELDRTNLEIIHEGNTILITASGYPEGSTLQWYHVSPEGVETAIEGQTNPRLMLAVTAKYNGDFYLKAHHGLDTYESSRAHIVKFVYSPLIVNSTAHTETVKEHKSATFGITLPHHDEFTHVQWFYRAHELAAEVELMQFADKTEIHLDPVTMADAGEYFAVVTRFTEAKRSEVIKLVVEKEEEALRFNARLSAVGSIRVPEHTPYQLYVQTDYNSPSTQYEWYKVIGGQPQLIVGENTSTLAFESAEATHQGHYYARVFQGISSETTDAVFIEVVPQAETISPIPTLPASPTTESELTEEELIRTRQYPDNVGIYAISIDKYCEKMYEGNIIKPEEGQHAQVVFYRDIIRILNIKDIDTYMDTMDMLIDHFWVYRKTVFDMKLRGRFLSGMPVAYMSRNDVDAFLTLLNLFAYMADPENNIPQSTKNVEAILGIGSIASSRLIEYIDRKRRAGLHASLLSSEELARQSSYVR